MRAELVELTSEAAYDMLAAYMRDRGTRTLLPHPAIRSTP